MEICTLNCQRGHNGNLKRFFKESISNQRYDFLLLQEANWRVFRILEELIGENYQILREFSPSIFEKYLAITIVYKSSWELMESKQVPNIELKNNPYKYFFPIASIIGKFERKSDHQQVVIGTTHQFPGLNPTYREPNVRKLKEEMLNLESNANCIKIIGGDFNTTKIGERVRNNDIMSLDFVNVRNEETTTYDSRRMEIHDPGSLLVRFISYFPKGRFKISLDDIYLDNRSAEFLSHEASVLSNIIVSDHYPVSLKIGI